MNTNWISGYVNSNGFDLFYTRTGGEKRPIVLAHGYTDDGSCWTDVARFFEKDYDLIMYDAIGHGQSARISEDMPLDMVADMHKVITDIGLSMPAIIGHSMGAATAAGYAVAHPENVSVIILEDIPWFYEIPNKKKEESKKKSKNILEDLQKGTQKEAVEFSKVYNPNFIDSMHKPWAASKMGFDLTYQKRKWEKMPNWKKIAVKIQCPTLLITGDVDKGAIVTPQLALEALKIIPNSEWAHIPNSPHCIRYEQFNVTMTVIKNFLRMKYPTK